MWERLLGLWEQMVSLVGFGPEPVFAIILAFVIFSRAENDGDEFFARTYLPISLPAILAVCFLGRGLYAAGGAHYALFLVLLVAGVTAPALMARGIEAGAPLVADGIQRGAEYHARRRQLAREQAAPEYRARVAIEAGRLREGLRLYAQAGDVSALMDAIRTRVPDWSARAVLLAAINELIEVDRGSRIAGSVGAMTPIVAGFGQSAREALEALWGNAERLAAVAAQGYMSEAVERRLEREREKLDRVRVAAQHARESLVDLTLPASASRDVDAATRELEALREATKDIEKL